MRAFALALLLVHSGHAAAQERSADDQALVRQLARQHFETGVAASEEGRWEEARVAFTRAYDLTSEVLVLLNLAVAESEVGDLVRAEQTYRRFLETSDPVTHASYRAQAEAALGALVPRVPRVSVRVAGVDREDEVLMDGTPVEHTALRDVRVNPGPHVASVRRAGRVMHEVSFAIEEGRTLEIQLTAPLELPDTSAGGRGAETEGPGPGPGPGGTRTQRRSVFKSPWFWAAVGTVVVAGVTTGVVLALKDGPDPFVGNLPPGRWIVR